MTSVYGVNQLLKNEAKIAQSQHIAIYGLMQSTGSAVLPSYWKIGLIPDTY